MLTISQCRKILGNSCSSMSDLEIEELRNNFMVLSDIAIDCYLAKRNKLKVNAYEKIQTPKN